MLLEVAVNPNVENADNYASVSNAYSFQQIAKTNNNVLSHTNPDLLWHTTLDGRTGCGQHLHGPGIRCQLHMHIHVWTSVFARSQQYKFKKNSA